MRYRDILNAGILVGAHKQNKSFFLLVRCGWPVLRLPGTRVAVRWHRPQLRAPIQSVPGRMRHSEGGSPILLSWRAKNVACC